MTGRSSKSPNIGTFLRPESSLSSVLGSTLFTLLSDVGVARALSKIVCNAVRALIAAPHSGWLWSTVVEPLWNGAISVNLPAGNWLRIARTAMSFAFWYTARV